MSNITHNKSGTMYVREFTGDPYKRYCFWCEGCGCYHTYDVGNTDGKPTWTFNGDMEKPTFHPSLLHTRPLVFGGWQHSVFVRLPARVGGQSYSIALTAGEQVNILITFNNNTYRMTPAAFGRLVAQMKQLQSDWNLLTLGNFLSVEATNLGAGSFGIVTTAFTPDGQPVINDGNRSIFVGYNYPFSETILTNEDC